MTDLEFITAILPKHYRITQYGDSYRCISRNGISEKGNDTFFKGMVLEPLTKYFGDRLLEVYHSTNANHTDFTIYLKWNKDWTPPTENYRDMLFEQGHQQQKIINSMYSNDEGSDNRIEKPTVKYTDANKLVTDNPELIEKICIAYANADQSARLFIQGIKDVHHVIK